MKDTLQTTPLPHELLGVEPGCSDRKTIRNAWVAAIQRGEADHATLKLAHDILLDPVRRMEYELLLYRRESFDDVTPSPFEEPSALEPQRRTATARAWETQLRKQGSNISLAHALAVLWYWWANHEQHTLTEELGKYGTGAAATNGRIAGLERRLNALHDRWSAAIGYWGMVVSTPLFWESLASTNGAGVSAVREKCIARLQNELHDLGQNEVLTQATGNRSDLLRQISSLEHDFVTELTTAHEVGELRIVKFGYAGPLLLKQMGVTEQVYRELAKKIEQRPERKRYRKLHGLLSPYRAIETLVTVNPEHALSAIAALPEAERNLEEVACVWAEARQKRGRQLAELGRHDDALEMWSAARKQPRKKRTDDQIVADVVSTCLEAAAGLDGKQLDKAIDILEQGLAIVNGDERLEAGLSDRLTHRGVARINKAQEEAGNSPDVIASKLPELVVVFDKAIADLDRAASLGSKNAARLASDAREARTNLRAGPYFTQGMDRINRALERAQSEGRITGEIETEIQRGIRDLDKAAELGSDDARERAVEIRDLLRRKAEYIPPLPSSYAPLFQNAQEFARKGKWEEAIDCLESIRGQLPESHHRSINRHLAACYLGRAVDSANEAVKIHQPAVQERQMYVMSYKGSHTQFFKRILNLAKWPKWNEFKCADCGDVVSSGATFQGRTICNACLWRLEKLAKPVPTRRVVDLISSAVRDARKAQQLDPEAENIRTQLSQIESLQQDVV